MKESWSGVSLGIMSTQAIFADAFLCSFFFFHSPLKEAAGVSHDSRRYRLL
jgi:hypothetical protein